MLKRILNKILFIASITITNSILYAQPPTIHGIYGNPAPFWEKGWNLSELGVNAIFVHGQSIDSALMIKAEQDELMVFAEFATLNGKNYVQDHPEAWAINEHGERVEAASWFMGVCPSDSGFIAYRMNQLRNLLQHYPVKGVWLDYLHWHAQFEEPIPTLPETCFCNNCLEAFHKHSGIKVPDGKTSEKAHRILRQYDKEWRTWRCQVIVDWVKKCRQIIQEERPGALLGVYHCPWDNQEFGHARKRILGLDFDLLRHEVDVFSPMVYHGRMERSTDWVAEYVDWLGMELDLEKKKAPKIWPIVQAHNVPAEEFEKVLRGGLKGVSSGVMMFTSGAVADDTQKTEIMQKLYNK